MINLIIGVIYLTTMLFDGVSYEMMNTSINHKAEAIFLLEIDLSKDSVKVKNGFSFGQLYGFETTSEMAEREKAIAAVNGMFYQDFGLPVGMVIHEGRPVTSLDIGTPMVVLGENGEVDIVNIEMEIVAQKGRFDNEDQFEERILSGINGAVADNHWGAYSQLYGSTTRIRRYSTNYLISEGRVTQIIGMDSPTKIEEADYILSYVGEDQSYAVGDNVDIAYKTQFDDFVIEEGFQTGGWLVKDGLNIAKDYEPFLGYTTAPQPRTMVGITELGHLIFVVVDGRDKNYSLGLSGKEAADLMIKKGCIKAAYLDGGASSTMYINGEVVNQPSGRGERAIAHSILVCVDKLEDK